MSIFNRRAKYHFTLFFKYDLKAGVAVFFVALPLCLGIALASNAPVYSGLISGIIGGLVITLISKSALSVSGPAAGLTAICAAIITQSSLEVFFLSVAIAGVLQVFLGIFRLGGFTHLIPSSIIKGMLSAIGILLIAKQIPLLIGYNQPDFWTNQLFNILTFNHGFQHIVNLYQSTSAGAIIIALSALLLLVLWEKKFSKKITFIPGSFVIVLWGVVLAVLFKNYFPSLQLTPSQYINVPKNIFSQIKITDFKLLFSNSAIWQNAVIICFVASLETLLSIEAIDKLDPYNRVSPPNRELIAQGAGNFFSGLLGGLPVTAVIVRSSANAEAGAKTKLSAITHGLWLLVAIVFAASLLNYIPYCVLAVILARTGYNLAKPKMIFAVYRQGKEQFFPFLVTIVAILFTDLLIGVLIGFLYAVYFLIKHTYRAGFVVRQSQEGHNKHFKIELALNVSFLNKRRVREMLDKIPEYSIVEIIGTNSVYIDRDILEIFQDYKTKAHKKHIQLNLQDIPAVETIELH